MNRFVKDRYSEKYKATIGADTMNKEITVDDKTVSLQVCSSPLVLLCIPFRLLYIEVCSFSY